MSLFLICYLSLMVFDFDGTYWILVDNLDGSAI